MMESRKSESIDSSQVDSDDLNQSSSNQLSPSIGLNEHVISRETLTVPSYLVDQREADSRPYDLVIFAASSSVGKFLVEEMALVAEKYYSSPTPDPDKTTDQREFNQFSQQVRRRSVPRHVNSIRWAIAGRSAMKLSETLCRAELSTGIKGLSAQVPVMLADLNQHRSLLDMSSKTKLVINCAGPYSIDGESVIRACLETKTNYIDLSHENTFIERIRQRYSEKALHAGVYIINGCGFQSMSAEMGLVFTKQVVDGQIDEVKIILNLSDSMALIKPSVLETRVKQTGIITWGMWCSFLIDKAQESSITSIQSAPTNNSQQVVAKKLRRKDTQTLVRDLVLFRNRSSFIWLQLFRGFEECGRKYCLPLGSVTSEEVQLIRGEMATYEHRKPDLDSTDGWRPIRCKSFMSMRSLGETVIFLVWLFLLNIFIKFSFVRRLMNAWPSIFSLGHVDKNTGHELDRDSLSHIKFCQTFLAYGTPGDNSGDPLEQRDKNLKRKQEQLLVARIVGPEPNHIASATFAIQAALALILERDHMPSSGGVLTPGAAFSETNIIYLLRRRNIKFEVMKKA